jgi:polyribonucleotide 5'-hydroxyl-kinase
VKRSVLNVQVDVHAGARSAVDPLEPTPVVLSNEAVYSLLGVSYAQTPEELSSMNVAGFVYIKDVNVLRGTVTYLAPCPGPLAGNFLLMGSFKTYFDS